MRRHSSIPLAMVLWCAAPCAVVASTPGTPGPWSSDTFPTTEDSAIVVTSHMKYVITQVRGDRVVRVWDKSSKKNHLVRIAEDVPIKVRKKKDFEGREEIEFADLRPGHRVKLSYRTSDGLIVGVKVIDRVSVSP